MKENPDERLFLGIDTSAYTTSVAIADSKEKVIFDCRKLLPVKEGSLGLRQSEAVFSHLQNLTDLLQGNDIVLSNNSIAAVAASTRPRPVEGSYMPVFKVSEALGLFLAQTAGLKYYGSSHQEGHLIAGLWSAGLSGGRFLALHLSGGTSEILTVEELSPGKLNIQKVGGSTDLNAGQFIDRIGLLMGLSFPAGPNLEVLACESGENQPTLPVAVKDSDISFSGPASHAERLLNKGCCYSEMARSVEICVADSVITAVHNLPIDINSFDGLLGVGGVLSNKLIRSRLEERLLRWKIYFADHVYASDNAVGLAIQAKRLLLS